ncbi:MAG: hypothetical protein BWX98_02277 [Candidatus Aminicenantes bacterium ADurb.Bin147]|nr:MAG: hypothetical protein BWX98_02277 [Candidatus Aminicenantes bacterium ADurb.Bin147]
MIVNRPLSFQDVRLGRQATGVLHREPVGLAENLRVDLLDPELTGQGEPVVAVGDDELALPVLPQQEIAGREFVPFPLELLLDPLGVDVELELHLLDVGPDLRDLDPVNREFPRVQDGPQGLRGRRLDPGIDPDLGRRLRFDELRRLFSARFPLYFSLSGAFLGPRSGDIITFTPRSLNIPFQPLR